MSPSQHEWPFVLRSKSANHALDARCVVNLSRRSKHAFPNLIAPRFSPHLLGQAIGGLGVDGVARDVLRIVVHRRGVDSSDHRALKEGGLWSVDANPAHEQLGFRCESAVVVELEVADGSVLQKRLLQLVDVVPPVWIALPVKEFFVRKVRLATLERFLR